MRDLQNVTVIFDATIDLSKETYAQTTSLQLRFADLIVNCVNVVFLGQIVFQNLGAKRVSFVQPLLNAYNLTYAAKINNVGGYTITSGWSGETQTDIELASSLIGISVIMRHGDGYSYYCQSSLPIN